MSPIRFLLGCGALAAQTAAALLLRTPLGWLGPASYAYLPHDRWVVAGSSTLVILLAAIFSAALVVRLALFAATRLHGAKPRLLSPANQSWTAGVSLLPLSLLVIFGWPPIGLVLALPVMLLMWPLLLIARAKSSVLLFGIATGVSLIAESLWFFAFWLRATYTVSPMSILLS